MWFDFRGVFREGEESLLPKAPTVSSNRLVVNRSLCNERELNGGDSSSRLLTSSEVVFMLRKVTKCYR